MICSFCKQDKGQLKSAVIRGVYIKDRCDSCLTSRKPQEMSAKWVRDRQREDHRKSLLQRWDYGAKNDIDENWARAYPEEAKKYFGEDKLEERRI